MRPSLPWSRASDRSLRAMDLAFSQASLWVLNIPVGVVAPSGVTAQPLSCTTTCWFLPMVSLPSGPGLDYRLDARALGVAALGVSLSDSASATPTAFGLRQGQAMG